MKNLNAEQIIKALECCISGDDCTICPLCDEQSCPCVLNENALSLINELTQANEQLSESYDHLEKTKDELLAERSRLTAENERLRAENKIEYETPCGKQTMPSLLHLEGAAASLYTQIKNKIKFDTVRKMRQRIKEYFPYDADSGLYVVLDQIANEMLENADDK